MSVNNQLHCKSSLAMYEPDDSVTLIVTSPPYFNAGKEYQKPMELHEYRNFIERSIRECYRVLRDGGRLAFNVAGAFRRPYIPVQAMCHRFLGYYFERCLGEIIWYKGAALGCTTAWGSWRKPSCPCLRDVHEYILVYQKGSRKLVDVEGKAGASISKDVFIKSTRSVWEIAPKSSKLHPAVFSAEIPRRLILLYSYPNDIILDPFCGIGTTCIEAQKLGRRWIGYDTEKKYIKAAYNALEIPA